MRINLKYESAINLLMCGFGKTVALNSSGGNPTIRKVKNNPINIDGKLYTCSCGCHSWNTWFLYD